MVQTLINGADARKFAECTCTTFGIPDELKVPVTEIIAMQDQNIENYIGYIGNTAVGTATRFYSNGIAGIYNVATLPKFQGKGIGLEIMTSLLLDAKQDGYQTVILHATPAGIRLYEKLGFQAYGEMKQYFFE
jgi:ribosomal protein S18 acetylase RimI-like enzyme